MTMLNIICGIDSNVKIQEISSGNNFDKVYKVMIWFCFLVASFVKCVWKQMKMQGLLWYS